MMRLQNSGVNPVGGLETYRLHRSALSISNFGDMSDIQWLWDIREPRVRIRPSGFKFDVENRCVRGGFFSNPECLP